ncbi:MAG: molecular chaperone Hsp90 [Clostridia bacterium]|nr:molecular chaperone Hsp90 [Clostridia bacterium]
MNRSDIVELTKELLAVPHCCAELKDAGRAWLEALDTPFEQDAAKAYVNELEEDVMRVDNVIAFFSSPAAAEHFGGERAAAMAAHMHELKAKGAVYCDCAACAKGAAILAAKELLVPQED